MTEMIEFYVAGWDFNYGEPFTEETVQTILTMLRPSYVRGLTLLGGEPFEPQNQAAVVELLRQVKAELPEKSCAMPTANALTYFT